MCILTHTKNKQYLPTFVVKDGMTKLIEQKPTTIIPPKSNKKAQKVKKAIVLNSGGIDSTTCIAIAINDVGAENVTSVSVDYGQKHIKELACAEAVANFYNLKHRIINLKRTGIYDDSTSSLFSGSTEAVPEKSYEEQLAENSSGLVSTYIPSRNALMLAAAAGLAQSMYPEDEIDVYLGAHAGGVCPDCSETFASNLDAAIYEGSGKRVHLIFPLVRFDKPNVVKVGLGLGAPYHLTWSCYLGGDKQCGKCGTCLDRKAAFAANNATDPVPYI